jgi:hypothetical protein
MFVGYGFGLFFLFFAAIWLVTIGGLILGISAIISVARTPPEAFGPWWDNTRQLWLIGIAVGFVVPFGALIAGIMWFSSGRASLRAGYGVAGRPFWAGPPKPPPLPPPGYSGAPGYPGFPGYPPAPGYPAAPGYPPGPPPPPGS